MEKGGKASLCLKFTFIILQVLFLICGLALLGVGVWLEVVDQVIVQAVQNNIFLVGPYLLIAVGAAIVVVAVLGIIGGACQKKFNRVLLILYIAIVFIIFLAEIAGGILAYVYRAQARELVVGGLTTAIEQHYGQNTTTASGVTRAVDEIQQQFECCGMGSNNSAIEDFWANVEGEGMVPPSCCNTFATNPEMLCVPSNRFNVTCDTAVLDFVENNLLVVATLGVVLVLVEVVVFLIAICLLYSTEYS